MLSPSRGQQRLALIAALLLLAVFLATLPFGHVRLGRIDVFIPIVATVMFLNDTITSVLLLAQFVVLRRVALLALATGYLFTGLLMIPYVLTFPGAFSPSGWLGAGLQSTGWLFTSSHIGLPAAAIVYVLLKDAEPAHLIARQSVRAAIVASTLGVLCAMLGLTWLVTVHNDVLPALMDSVLLVNPVWNYLVAPGMLLLCAVATALLWLRQRTLLDLWLLMVAWAWLLDTILLCLIEQRFTVAWYANRLFGISSATFVLVVLLSESTMMYARLALSVMAQRREREGRLMTMDAVAASIAHEINQPLAAIVTSSGAGLRWLERTPPNLDEARAALRRIANDGHRAGKVIDSIRAIFKQGGRPREQLVVNEVVRGALAAVHDQLEARRVALQLELPPGLPPVLGHKDQLQQVVVNIATNAAEAMATVAGRPRILRIRTGAAEGGAALAVTLEDSGAGIDPDACCRIFDPFYTTKPDGMGMGLAICRSIVESHGGRLRVSPGSPYGAVFHMRLPAAPSGSE